MGVGSVGPLCGAKAALEVNNEGNGNSCKLSPSPVAQVVKVGHTFLS